MENQKNKPAAPAFQKQIDQIAEENKLNRLCPICDNLQEWVEEEKIMSVPSVEDGTDMNTKRN
ncbi:MAG TPA: hypothetical protein VK791_01130 [bacterium]|jgi:hypothetical protein|nr:hypothetical protein [bacterium]